MSKKEPFAVIIPDEMDLTAPLAAGTELTKLYMIAAQQLEQLHKEIYTEEIRDEEGNIIRTITHIPPDYKWLLEYCRKIGANIIKVTQNAQAKQVDTKLRVVDLFMNSDAVSKEQKEEFMAQALRKRINVEEAEDLPIKDKDREW